VTEEFADQNLNPDRDSQQSFGDQFGRQRSSPRSRTIRTVAGPLIASSPNPAAIRPDFDLDLFGILGVARCCGRSALWTDAFVFGQFVKFFDNWQILVIPPPWSRTPLALAAWSRWRRRLIVVLAIQSIRAVARSGLFALLSEQPRLQFAILAAELIYFSFEYLDFFRRPSVHRLPIPDLLPQFQVLTTDVRQLLPQLGGLLPQTPNLAEKLLHETR
jgi:hypothetical protein